MTASAAFHPWGFLALDSPSNSSPPTISNPQNNNPLLKPSLIALISRLANSLDPVSMGILFTKILEDEYKIGVEACKMSVWQIYVREWGY